MAKFTRPGDLVCKHLNEMGARQLPDGEVHPDDLGEAQLHAFIEYAETREPLRKPGLPKKPTPDLTGEYLHLALATAMDRYAAGDTKVVDDLSGFLSKALHNQQLRESNAPKNPARLPDAPKIRQLMDELRAQGVKEGDLVKTIASEFNVTRDAVYKRLNRAKTGR